MENASGLLLSVLLCYLDSVYRVAQNGFIASLHNKKEASS